MNEFRMSLLKERAEKIRPDLTKARQMMEQAEAEKRDLTDEEKAFTEPTLKTARDIADSMAKTRDEDATIKAIKGEFADVMGPMAGGDLSLSGSGGKSRRLSFAWHGFSGRQADAARRHEGTGTLWCGCGGPGDETGSGSPWPAGAESARR